MSEIGAISLAEINKRRRNVKYQIRKLEQFIASNPEKARHKVQAIVAGFRDGHGSDGEVLAALTAEGFVDADNGYNPTF